MFRIYSTLCNYVVILEPIAITMLEIRWEECVLVSGLRFSKTQCLTQPNFLYKFRLLDRRDTVLWVEMDHRQKEWVVSKEQYLS